jgi:hypothetical protein
VLFTFDEALGRYDITTGQPLPGSGAAGLKATLPELAPVLKDVAFVTRGLRGTTPGDLQKLLSSSADVTSTLAGSSSELADLVTSLNVTATALAATDGSLAQSVAGLDRTLQAAPAALTAIDRALPPVVELGRALDPSLRLAPPLVDGLTQAVGDLAAIVSPAERGNLLISLKSTFQQFPALLTKLGSAFPISRSVTDCLRTHVLPLLKRTVPDGALSSGRPVWQDFVHFVGGLAGASQNFDANGNWVRLLAGAGTNTVSLGTLPVVGQLLATGAPGGSPIQGARPAWVGDLTPDVYQPGVPCASQPLPNLASPTAAPDTFAAHSPPPAQGAAQILAALARVAKQGSPR